MREHLGELLDGAFGTGVGRLVGQRDVTHDAGDVDDLPGALFDHAPARGSGAEEVAVEVGRQDLLVFVEPEFEDRLPDIDTRVVHEDVDAAQRSTVSATSASAYASLGQST